QQGKNADAAQQLLDEAQALVSAGVYALVLESIPHHLAEQITNAISVPSIGIGAGAGCNGQVLVCYDLLGLDPNFSPSFVNRYREIGKETKVAFTELAHDGRSGGFPRAANTKPSAAPTTPISTAKNSTTPLL